MRGDEAQERAADNVQKIVDAQGNARASYSQDQEHPRKYESAIGRSCDSRDTGRTSGMT